MDKTAVSMPEYIECDNVTTSGLVDAAEKITIFLNKHKVHLGNEASMSKLNEEEAKTLVSLLEQYKGYGGDIGYFVSGAGAYGNCVIC